MEQARIDQIMKQAALEGLREAIRKCRNRACEHLNFSPYSQEEHIEEALRKAELEINDIRALSLALHRKTTK